MSEYIVNTDELIDFAYRFLIDGEECIGYSKEELSEEIERTRFQRLTRCKECIWGQKIKGFYVCCAEGVLPYFVDGNHFCSSGEPKEKR